MLHILGMILKTAGILLGSILGILLLSVLLILFVPVRYRVKGSYEEKPEINARISWLFPLLSVQILYKEGEMSAGVRVFGILLKKKKKDKPAECIAEEMEQAVYDMPDRQRETAYNGQKAENEAKQPEEAPAGEASQNPLAYKIRTWIQKIKCTIQGICDKIKTVKAKKEEIRAFIKDEENKEAFRLLKRELIRLWKEIRPGKLSVSCHFGFEDPAVTGQILAAGAVFYPVYKDKLRLYPDFQQKVLYGKADVSGRIRIFPLLLIIIRLWRNRRIRSAIKKFMK